MTQTFAVSPAFILKAHKVACSSWKTKLEGMYPVVFNPTTRTFKQGDRVQFPLASGFDDVTYILANTGNNNMTLVSLANGNRWADNVKVANSSSVTIDEMTAICGTHSLANTLVNGATPNLKPLTSTRKTLSAVSDVILQAYEAASDSSTKEMIKTEFPALFANKYVNFENKFTLSSDGNAIDDVQFVIGVGLAPRAELRNRCLVVSDNDCEVEIIRKDGRTIIAFKKK